MDSQPDNSLDWPVRMIEAWLEAYSQDSLESVTIRTAGGREFVLQPPAAKLVPTDNGQLSPLEAAILAVASKEPKPAKVLARLANRPCGSHFYEALASLQRKRPSLIVRTPDGFHLP